MITEQELQKIEARNSDPHRLAARTSTSISDISALIAEIRRLSAKSALLSASLAQADSENKRLNELLDIFKVSDNELRDELALVMTERELHKEERNALAKSFVRFSKGYCYYCPVHGCNQSKKSEENCLRDIIAWARKQANHGEET